MKENRKKFLSRRIHVYRKSVHLLTRQTKQSITGEVLYDIRGDLAKVTKERDQLKE